MTIVIELARSLQAQCLLIGNTWLVCKTMWNACCLVHFPLRPTQAACLALGIPRFTPHSGRAGFATDALLAGRDFTSIREDGRWLSDASLRVYLDAVAMCSLAASEAGHRWGQTALLVEKHFSQCYPWWPGCPLVASQPLPPNVLQASRKFDECLRALHTLPNS